MNSDKLILAEIEKKNENLKNSNFEENQIKAKIRKKRKNIEFMMINKIRDLKILYKNFEPLFENDFNNISNENDLNFDSIIKGYKKNWFKSDFFYKLMNWVYIRKNLDVKIFELNSKFENLKILKNENFLKLEKKKIFFVEEKKKSYEEEKIDRERNKENFKRNQNLREIRKKMKNLVIKTKLGMSSILNLFKIDKEILKNFKNEKNKKIFLEKINMVIDITN